MTLQVNGYSPVEGRLALNESKHAHFDRWVDFASVVLISVATILTAWSGYEAARWTGLQTKEYNQAGARRLEASVASTRADALTTIDVAMFLQYIAAVTEGRYDLQTFIRRRFRPEMKRAADAWLATKPLQNPHAPSSPFFMPQYQLQTNREAARLNSEAASHTEAAQEANEFADEYVRLTVIFAAVSFLGGISTRFVFPNHIVVVSAGFATLLFGVIRLLGMPFR